MTDNKSYGVHLKSAGTTAPLPHLLYCYYFSANNETDKTPCNVPHQLWLAEEGGSYKLLHACFAVLDLHCYVVS